MNIEPYLFLAVVSGGLGLFAGFVMDRADFCLAGMFRDYFLFRDLAGLRVFLLLVAATMAMFEAGRLTGILPAYPFPLLGPPALTNVIGGFAFGIGMVLAGGCVVGTLYRLGRGSLPAILTLVGLLVGSVLYAELDPWWGEIGRATRLSDHVTVPQMLGISPLWPVTVILVGTFVLFLRPSSRDGWVRPASISGYVQPWQAALLLAGCSFVSYVLVGMPMGITTAYAKIGAFVEGMLFPSHVASVVYYQRESLSYVPPFGRQVVTGGAAPVFDAIAAVQFPLIGGIIAGAACSALLLREWQLYHRLPRRQVVSVLCGGVLMGFAARLAPACNVWHLLGGLPILAGQSLLFLLGLFPGARVGSSLLQHFVLNRT